MAINFPDSPTNGQVATVGGKNYTYNSTKNTWTPTQVTEADLSSIGSTTVVATHDLLPTSPSAGDMALVSSVNKMYVYFLSGWWLMSSLQNASPSGITGNAAIYDLAADGTPTTVTLSSSDPEGFPIVWSHSVISGSLGGTTVTNVNNVFTITPSTDAADAGTFTLRFAASDGQGGESGSQSQFTLDFVFTITNSNYTTLLATAVDTSDNNNITDASTNNYLITVNGDAHAGTFSPYRSGGYSTYFDGSGDYLTATGTAIGTGDFTLEAWIYTASFSNYRTIFTNRGSSNSTGNFVLGVDSAAQVYLYSNNFLITSSSTLSANTWHHVALVRNGTGSGSTVLYIDGSSVGSADVSNNFSDTAYDIGGDTVDSYHWNGYISDLRVNIGTAIYISAFTPPTERLTAITNTSLLTCHLPYIADGSTNNYSITVNGDVSTKPFSPYDYSVEYSATDHGGSVAFDGTGDYLLTSALIPATDNFTIEGWVYSTSTDDSQTICGQRTNSGNGRFAIYIKSGGNINFGQTDSSVSGLEYTSSNSEALNKWCHFVLMRTSSNIAFYVNGERVLNTTSGTFEQTNFEIGTDVELDGVGLNYGLYGFVSDLRVSLSAKYSEGTSVTIPTTPLSSTGAALHIKGTDASIIDKAQVNNLKLVGNTTGSTTTNFTGAKSINLTGSNDYLVAESEDILTQDYTIETWIYAPTGGFAATGYVFDTRPQTSIQNGISLYMNSNTAYLRINGGTKITSGTTLSDQNWHHVAISRSGSNTKLFFNGSQTGSTYTVLDTIYSPKFFIGIQSYNASAINGVNAYLQDFRFTKGLARYTANFTPPTASLEG